MTEKKIDCEQALKQILEYVDRELPGEDERAMQEHLHACKSCFSRMEFERLLKGKVRDLRDDEASKSMSERVKSLLKDY